MSEYYSAGQFEHAFKPTKLKNWMYGTHPWPGRFAICACSKPRSCFIADDNGHLLPCCAGINTCTSPWGDYATWIWEQPPPCSCCCIKAVRHPEDFKPRKLIYITRELCNSDEVSKEVAQEFNAQCTKEGMVEDMMCGRDPSCPGGGCCQEFGPQLTMVGDKKWCEKQMREQRRAEKRQVLGRGKTGNPCCPRVINLRYATGCGDAAKRGCRKRT